MLNGPDFILTLIFIIRSGSIGLNATVNHSGNANFACDMDPDDGHDETRLSNRIRLNSTSRADSVPVFRPAADCDRSNCTSDCDREMSR